MENNNTISNKRILEKLQRKIAIEEFRNQEINNNQIIKENEKIRTKNKYLVAFKKILIGISATISTIICGGAVYAALGGQINDIPLVEWLGIKFSNNYSEYEEKVENQYIENEYGRLEVQSTVCDEGFIILKFNLKFSEDATKVFDSFMDNPEFYSFKYTYKPFDFLSLNENGAGMNFNPDIIIDGKKYECYDDIQTINEIEKNREYEIYQMWFISDEILKNKNEFELTLKNIMLDEIAYYADNGKLEKYQVKFDKELKLKLSKEKAQQNTRTIKATNRISSSELDMSIDEIKITPLQNIVKINVNYANEEALYKELSYDIYDNKGNDLSGYKIDHSGIYIPYEENNEEYKSALKAIEKLKKTEYIVIDKDKTEFNIEVYQKDDENKNKINIGSFKVDLEKEKIISENKNKNITFNSLEESYDENAETNNIKYYKSTNYQWEDYPENLTGFIQNEVLMSYNYIEMIDSEGDPISEKTKKMIYSLYKNYDVEQFYGLEVNIIMPGIGDHSDDYVVESNYPQYIFPIVNDKIQKYNNPIKINTAVILEDWYFFNYKDININNNTLSQKVKNQYNRIIAENYNIEKEGSFNYTVDKIFLINGNNSSEEDFKNNARAKKIKVTLGNEKEYIFELEDTNKAQILDVSYKQSAKTPVEISIEVLEAYEGEQSQDIYISNIHSDI
ncbi:MAG: hypothetical protein IJV31_12090 [Clostridia bacterium]|nr:hypothetical protein [Clostridia bacterium]